MAEADEFGGSQAPAIPWTEMGYADPNGFRIEGKHTATGLTYTRWENDLSAGFQVLDRCAHCGHVCLDRDAGHWTLAEVQGRQRRVCFPACPDFPAELRGKVGWRA